MPKTSLPADSICSGLGRGAEDYTNLAAARAQLADREPRVDRSPREPDARRTWEHASYGFYYYDLSASFPTRAGNGRRLRLRNSASARSAGSGLRLVHRGLRHA